MLVDSNCADQGERDEQEPKLQRTLRRKSRLAGLITQSGRGRRQKKREICTAQLVYAHGELAVVAIAAIPKATQGTGERSTSRRALAGDAAAPFHSGASLRASHTQFEPEYPCRPGAKRRARTGRQVT